MNRKVFLYLLLVQMLIANTAFADEIIQQVKVADPFVEVHSGPGDGDPIFHVIERGELINVIQRRTSWFKISYNNKIEGWVNIEQMEQTLSPADEAIEFKQITQEDFWQRQWEVGVLGGEFGGAKQLSIYGAYLLNRGLAAELGYGESIGSASSSQLIKLGLLMQPFADWRVSPYFYLGTGIISVSPNATLIVPNDQQDQFSNVALGIRAYLSRKVIFRLEVANYVRFSANRDIDDNEEIREWKAGFAVFF